MNQYKITYSLFWGILLLCSGCKKFLSKEPLGPYSAQNYFNANPKNPEYAVNAIYDAISWDNYGRANETQGYELFFGDICSDDAEIGSMPGDALINSLKELKEWRANASHVSTEAVWIINYAAIARANYVLTYIDATSSIDQATKNRLKGEALFLRGYAYFYLARIFGGVPLVDHLLSPNEYGTYLRSTLAQTFQFIESDFKNATSLLPISQAPYGVGRATKGAALGYWARCIQYQLGTDNTLGHTWQEVYALTKQIILQGNYALLPNYAALFEEESENCIESIFEIQYMDTGNPNEYGPNSVGSFADQLQNPRSTFGWGYNTPSESLIQSFEEGDPRLKCTVLQDGDILYGQKFKIDTVVDPSKYINRKAALAEAPSSIQNGARNHRKMRYAEILLMNAEAAYYMGNTSEAIENVNLIRARAKSSTLPKGYKLNAPNAYETASVPATTLLPLEGLAGQDLLIAIYKERRNEFGMETLRLWDQIRTNTYISSLTSSVQSNCNSHSIQYQNNTIPLFPIPQNELFFNIAQNPGY
ncbi:MAG: RagB/SusD family nutrient uptake outer membrane protein [Cytophagales bacterium]